MKYLLFAIAVFFSTVLMAQKSISVDSVFLKSGEVIIGKIVNSDKFSLVVEQLGTGQSLSIKRGIIDRYSSNNNVAIKNSKKFTLMDAGDELIDASGLLAGGTVLSILGVGVSGASVFIEKKEVRNIMLGAGIGASIVGLACTLGGFAKIGSAGKVLQDIKLSEQARLDVNYYGLSASIRVRF